jgi:formylglycine-generating enzyme required for sulfatase activity
MFHRDFYLGKYLVTQEEWQTVMGINPSCFSRSGTGKTSVKDLAEEQLKRLPVENVTLNDCLIFITRLNQRVRESGWLYELPMEVEWEYACRGGPMSDKTESAFDFYFDKPTNQLLPEQANFEHRRQLARRTSKVGSYPPNRLGLYDMHGNVWEWCVDEGPADPKDPQGAPLRVARGGSWFRGAGRCRAADRFTAPRSDRNHHLGLRLARHPTASTAVFSEIGR